MKNNMDLKIYQGTLLSLTDDKYDKFVGKHCSRDLGNYLAADGYWEPMFNNIYCLFELRDEVLPDIDTDTLDKIAKKLTEQKQAKMHKQVLRDNLDINELLVFDNQHRLKSLTYAHRIKWACGNRSALYDKKLIIDALFRVLPDMVGRKKGHLRNEAAERLERKNRKLRRRGGR